MTDAPCPADATPQSDAIPSTPAAANATAPQDAASANTADANSTASDDAPQATAPSPADETATAQAETPIEPPKPAPPPPPPNLKALLVGNILTLALSLWVGLGPLMQGWHQNDSPFRGTPYSSPWPFYALSLAAILGIAAFALFRLIRHGKNPADRAFRLTPIATVIFIAIHLLFIRAIQNPHLPPSMILSSVFATAAFNPLTSDDGLFPTEPRFYADAFAQTPPPYWKNGEKLSRWNILVRERCTGPVDTRPGAVEPGTLLACLSEDRKIAWMSAVGLSHDLVGVPALVHARQKLLSVPLRIQPKDKKSTPNIP